MPPTSKYQGQPWRPPSSPFCPRSHPRRVPPTVGGRCAMTTYEIDRIRRGPGFRPSPAATWEDYTVVRSHGEARAIVEALQRLCEPYVYRIVERHLPGEEAG